MMVLSKKDTTVLRGLAILSIILHNFIHLPQFGFTEQNESSFVVQRTQDFLAGLGLASYMCSEICFHSSVGSAFLSLSSFPGMGW